MHNSCWQSSFSPKLGMIKIDITPYSYEYLLLEFRSLGIGNMIRLLEFFTAGFEGKTATCGVLLEIHMDSVLFAALYY